MAATLDTALGTHAQAASATNVLSTSNAVATGGLIVLAVGWFHNGVSTVAITGGSLTWQEDAVLRSGSLHISIQSAPAPSGLSSATNLTATFTGAGTPDSMMGAGSFLGCQITGTYKDASQTTNATSGTWSSGTITATAGSLGVGAGFEDGSVITSVGVSGSTELWDFNSAGQNESMACNYKLSVASSETIQGTWSAGTPVWIGAGVTYKLLAAAAPIPDIVMAPQL